MKRAVTCAVWIGIASMAGAIQHPAVEWKDGEIWLTREGEPPLQLTRDGCEKGREPAWAPDGAKVAYYTNMTVDKPSCPTEVVLLSAGGNQAKNKSTMYKGKAEIGREMTGEGRIE